MPLVRPPPTVRIALAAVVAVEASVSLGSIATPGVRLCPSGPMTESGFVERPGVNIVDAAEDTFGRLETGRNDD
jgi:hypothetical protein